MKRKNTPHYIVELQLKTQTFQEDIINTRMETGRSIYNALLIRLILKNVKHLSLIMLHKNILKNH